MYPFPFAEPGSALVTPFTCTFLTSSLFGSSSLTSKLTREDHRPSVDDHSLHSSRLHQTRLSRGVGLAHASRNLERSFAAGSQFWKTVTVVTAQEQQGTTACRRDILAISLFFRGPLKMTMSQERRITMNKTPAVLVRLNKENHFTNLLVRTVYLQGVKELTRTASSIDASVCGENAHGNAPDLRTRSLARPHPP